ncbi:MAG: TonB-dependent receptor [Phenylobacterium sp.]|nr:TonB-dependent receptor [Phenylobacterium sp.]
MALVVATAFAPLPALAQQVGADAGAEQRDVAELDAIVVTAQKRSERLQDVPIAIETLGEAALAAGPVTDITAIQLVSPAVSGSGNSSAQPLIAVRGIVSNDFSIGADPALGIYVDDVYTGRSAGAVQELVDIDRVEIVKGPQGTLFGRNTTAGAISIYTNRPDLGGFSGSAVTSIGDFDAVRASTTVNLHLDDQTAVRASMVYDRHDGFFENTVGGRRLDKADHLAGRAALRFQSGALDVILTGEYERDRDDGLVAKSIAYRIPGDEGFAKAKPPVSINARSATTVIFTAETCVLKPPSARWTSPPSPQCAATVCATWRTPTRPLSPWSTSAPGSGKTHKVRSSDWPRPIKRSAGPQGPASTMSG